MSKRHRPTGAEPTVAASTSCTSARRASHQRDSAELDERSTMDARRPASSFLDPRVPTPARIGATDGGLPGRAAAHRRPAAPCRRRSTPPAPSPRRRIAAPSSRRGAARRAFWLLGGDRRSAFAGRASSRSSQTSGSRRPSYEVDRPRPSTQRLDAQPDSSRRSEPAGQAPAIRSGDRRRPGPARLALIVPAVADRGPIDRCSAGPIPRPRCSSCCWLRLVAGALGRAACVLAGGPAATSCSRDGGPGQTSLRSEAAEPPGRDLRPVAARSSSPRTSIATGSSAIPPARSAKAGPRSPPSSVTIASGWTRSTQPGR